MNFILFVFGLFIGSFLNMLIDRMPREEQIVKGRSHCDHCQHALSWMDLIPVVSWMLLEGSCRYCKKKVSVRNTIVELLTGGVFVFTYATLSMKYGAFSSGIEVAQLFLHLVIFSCLITIFFIDLDHQIIPDSLTIIATVSAIALHLIELSPLSFQNYSISSIAAAGFFVFLILITKGRGMGWGDVKFAAFMGIFLGFPRIVFSLYFAFLTGAIVSAILIVRRRKKFGQTIAFGPFLVVGTFFAALGTLDIAWKYIFGNLL